MHLKQSLQKLKGSSLLSIADLDKDQILCLIELAIRIKNKEADFNYSDKVLGLIFEKSSTRTRVSFEVAMYRLKGNSIEISPSTSQIGRGESVKDTVRVLSRYVVALAIRTFEQSNIEEYEKWGNIPIINALTDLEHPCQVLADFLTIKEEFGDIDDLTLTYLGDGNNVANSLILCGALLGVQIKIGCPSDYEPNKDVIEKALSISDQNKKVRIYNDPYDAVKGANIVYTDVWASMGQELKAQEKEKLFTSYSLNQDLLSFADNKNIILHCLPAYRGKEITDEVMESKNSRIFLQAENRLHIQQALLASLLG